MMAENAQGAASEEHDIKVRDLPITWLRKIITMITVYDFDHNGHPDYDDFMVLADRLIKYGSVKEKAADDTIDFFRSYAKPPEDGVRSKLMRATVKPLGELIMAGWKVKDDPGVIKTWQLRYSTMFKIFDLNSSGYITFDEYMVFWGVYNLDPRFARMQFDYMDTDDDGKISEDEFVNTALDYIRNTDLDTKNRFYGPLIRY